MCGLICIVFCVLYVIIVHLNHNALYIYTMNNVNDFNMLPFCKVFGGWSQQKYISSSNSFKFQNWLVVSEQYEKSMQNNKVILVVLPIILL